MATWVLPGTIAGFGCLAFVLATVSLTHCRPTSATDNFAGSIRWTAPSITRTLIARTVFGPRPAAAALIVPVLAIVLVGQSWRGADMGRANVAADRTSIAADAANPVGDVTSPAQTGAGSLEKVPLSFVRNVGQANPEALLYAQGSDYSFAFMRGAANLTLGRHAERQLSLDLRFLAARPDALPEGRGTLPGTANFLYGNDQTKWHAGVPTYGQIAYSELWPGIDLLFAGGDGRLEYTFVAHPGASVEDIGLEYGGADALSIDAGGNLRIDTPAGVLTDARPETYQMVGRSRIAVESHFVLRSATTFGLAVGAHDRSLPLVIDPGLVYSTYLGGGSDDNGFAIANDAAGNAYVTGFTASSNFPTTAGAYDTSFNGGQDVFVTKLNPAGTSVLYSTYIGGSSNDQGLAIAVDASGFAYVTGFTGSTNFPTQKDPLTTPPVSTVYRPTYQGGSTDAFVTKLNQAGTGLVFSTYAGGSGADQGWGIAVHSSGDVYVTGDTTSTNLPVTPFPFRLQATSGGGMDAFFLRLDRFAAAAAHMTYIGGSGADSARAIAIDANRNVYLTGTTASTNFPTSLTPFDGSANGGEDAFATKLAYGGSTTVGGVSYDTYAYGYSTYLGGSGIDRGLGITVDGTARAYLTGLTTSTNFPTTAGAFATTNGGGDDAFVTKVNPGGGTLAYSTYLGGNGNDRGQGIALDSATDAHIAGRTSSSNFPTTPGAYDESYNGGEDAFVTKLNPAGNAPLLYSTFLGGSTGATGNNDRGMAIAVDASGNAYVTGLTASSDFPTTVGAYDRTANGGQDAFVTKLDMIGAPNSMTLTPATATNTVGNKHTVTATVRDFAGRPVPGVTVRFSVTGANTASGSMATNASGVATFIYTGTHAGPDAIHAYADTNGSSTQNPGEPFADATKIWMPGAPATLVLTPPTATNVVGAQHCVMATVKDAFGNPTPGITVRFSVTPATSRTPSSGSAVTNAGGEATFCYTSTQTGADAIHAYADTNNSTTQDVGEPFGDATKIWKPGTPATLVLTPVTATNVVGTPHTVTATVRDAFGNPTPGITVRFSVTGPTFPSPSSGSATTNGSGVATFTFTAALPGTNAITAYADTNGNGMQDVGEPSGAATKIWTPPPSTAFCQVTITNGGWIIANNGDKATFGGNAKVSNDGLVVKGQEVYQDHGPATPRMVKATVLLATTCDITTSPKIATIYGRATVDGSGDFVFRIDVTDGGSGGSTDSYGILMSDGYVSGQHALGGGNVDIHKS
jgi:hypothetical protein